MKEINLETPIWQLTVGEFLEISRDIISEKNMSMD